MQEEINTKLNLIISILLVVCVAVASAGCADRGETQIIKYNGNLSGNITKTIITHEGDNTTYVGRVMEYHDVPDEIDLVIFQDNLTVPCWAVSSHDWAPGKMHKLTIGPDPISLPRYIRDVQIIDE